ncbi:MAG: hypothetical protein GWO82_05570, partial [Bacteroidetes bacterium]|nr:hypothetical protein [Bacteroidota bacterium]
VVSQQTHTLDFVGRTTQTTTVETKNGNTLTKVDDYAYDHAGRLIDHDITLNGQKEDLVHNRYDELGQLEEKTVGGGLQTVDYDYNVRGWLRHINDPDALGDDLFGFELDYGSLYNGNIQNTYWTTANDNIKRNYRYNYDGLNRLTNASYYAPGTYWGAYNSNYTYDRNGNIKRLYRSNGERIGIDYLNYTYDGNQLQAVTDTYKHSEGFNDGNTTGFDYIYDANGNLKEDKNKGITMQYNHLNFPYHVWQGTQNRSLNYVYDATGVKHKKVFDTTNTIYTPTGVYKNNTLELVFTPEGYAEPKAGGFTHVYQYKDHLGNNRLSYADANGNGRIDTPGSTAITVWEETFEDKSKTNNDWDGSGNTWGWPITDIVSDKAHSGSKSGMLQNTTPSSLEIVTHSNEWVNINNSKPTLYKYSGWVFIEPHNHYAEIFFFMKKEGETAYNTLFDRIGTATRGKWVFLEKVVMVPESIKTINIRIDNDGTSDAKVWFDDIKIEQLDLSQNEIVSETNYYPFGLAHKGYNEHVNSTNLGEQFKFNGKEEENELGLGWTDYGARRYMKDLGRWAGVDALAEKYETLSPYAYVANTPTNAIDPDGRLIVYVNGLLFNQALGHKTTGYSQGEYVGHYRYPPPRNFFYNQEPTMFEQEIGRYWGGNNGIRSTINRHFGDNNNIFINGTDQFNSQASDRYAQGQKSGLELISKLQNGTIVLENEETIKIVGHSQGAAYAAGILATLADSEFASRVELGLYLSPHQPGDFKHPDGIPGAQFSTGSDWVSSKSGVLGKLLNAFNGQSELSKIEGADFLLIRPNHDGGKGGHDVDTWNDILQQISDFLNDD